MSVTISAVHINWTETHYVVFRESLGERWCFVCRKRRAFEHVRKAPIAMSYYGPFDQVECTSCRTVDGDCFPGSGREWPDE
jgi:hypothetical protein